MGSNIDTSGPTYIPPVPDAVKETPSKFQEYNLTDQDMGSAYENNAKKPTSIKNILDFVGNIEAPKYSYNQIYGFNNRADLTSKTLNEVFEFQKTLPGTQVVGRYQIKPSTLREAAKKLKLKGSEKFDEVLQDKLAIQLMTQKGLTKFLSGELSAEEFGNNLSKEWASLPLLSDNVERGLKRGESFYKTVGNNKSLTSPENFLKVLQGKEKQEIDNLTQTTE